MGTKRLFINGSAVWISNFPTINLQTASRFIRNRIESMGGWRIINWTFLYSASSAGQWLCPCDFVIGVEAEVSDTFSDNAHRDYFTAELNNYRYSTPTNLVPVITDVRLEAKSFDINNGQPLGKGVRTGFDPKILDEIKKNAKIPDVNTQTIPATYIDILNPTDVFDLSTFLGTTTGILVIAGIAYFIFRD